MFTTYTMKPSERKELTAMREFVNMHLGGYVTFSYKTVAECLEKAEKCFSDTVNRPVIYKDCNGLGKQWLRRRTVAFAMSQKKNLKLLGDTNGELLDDKLKTMLANMQL